MPVKVSRDAGRDHLCTCMWVLDDRHGPRGRGRFRHGSNSHPETFMKKEDRGKSGSAHASFLQAALLQQLRLDAEWLGSSAADCCH